MHVFHIYFEKTTRSFWHQDMKLNTIILLFTIFYQM